MTCFKVILAAATACLMISAAEPEHCDILVYGATAGGAMAAVAAAGEGSSVILLEPGGHVGGMVSGGLGRTDMDGQLHLIGGLARKFFETVGQHYGQSIAWFFEPKVAEATLKDFLAKSGVKVRYGQPLLRVVKNRDRIVRLETRPGAAFTADVYVDGTYEGDLYKAAGVSYAIGRESRSKWGESFAGRQELLPGAHQLKVATPATDDKGKLVPYVRPETDLVPVGEGDGKVMGMGFRLCLTNDATNRVPIEKPEGYDSARFGLVRNYLKALGPDAKIGEFLGLSKMPNNKTDSNSATVSFNLLGAGRPYIDADYETRQKIWEEHRSWAQGLLYFLSHDESAPKSFREEVGQWGLPKDEFTDTGHWPHQLYIREARRMQGEYILTQRDLQIDRSKYDAVGMAAYNVDIREVQWIAKTVTRFPKIGLEVMMEGYLSMPVEPYEIPYRSLLPRYSECSNLLVPVALSASHIAYASYRMEPQYMIVGQSAGVAAAMASKQKLAVHRVNITALQARLRMLGQVLTSEDALPASPPPSGQIRGAN